MRDAVLAMLRKVVWRTSKVFAYAQLRIPAPVNHVIGCTLSSAERAWAARERPEAASGVAAVGGRAAARGPALEQQRALAAIEARMSKALGGRGRQ